jgi:hypothetical protein
MLQNQGEEKQLDTNEVFAKTTRNKKFQKVIT